MLTTQHSILARSPAPWGKWRKRSHRLTIPEVSTWHSGVGLWQEDSCFQRIGSNKLRGPARASYSPKWVSPASPKCRMFAFQCQIATAAPSLLRQYENRKAGRAEKCKRLIIFINSTEWGGSGARHGLSCTKEINTWWVLLSQWLRSPEPPVTVLSRAACANRTWRDRLQESQACLSLLGNGWGLPVFADRGRMGPFINIWL